MKIHLPLQGSTINVQIEPKFVSITHTQIRFFPIFLIYRVKWMRSGCVIRSQIKKIWFKIDVSIRGIATKINDDVRTILDWLNYTWKLAKFLSMQSDIRIWISGECHSYSHSRTPAFTFTFKCRPDCGKMASSTTTTNTSCLFSCHNTLSIYYT